MAASRALTEHDEIRQWAEARNAQPARVRVTGGGADVGMIRLDFPGFSGGESLEPISWDEWFRSFDENNLALLVQEETAGGEQSNFNKLVDRNTAAGVQRARSAAGAGGTSRGAAGGRARKSSARGGRQTARGRKTAAAGRKTSRAGARKSAARRKTSGRARAKGAARKATSSRRRAGGAKRR